MEDSGTYEEPRFVRRCTKQYFGMAGRLSSALLQIPNVLAMSRWFGTIHGVEASRFQMEQVDQRAGRGVHVVDHPRVDEAGWSQAVGAA